MIWPLLKKLYPDAYQEVKKKISDSGASISKSALLTGKGGEGVLKSPTIYILLHISHNEETWHSYTHLKMIQKINKSRDTLLTFCWHQHFLPGIINFLLYREIQINKYIIINTDYIISKSFDFSWVFKDSFDQHDWNFEMISAKLAIPDFKIQVMTSQVMFMTSPTKLYYVNQIIL